MRQYLIVGLIFAAWGCAGESSRQDGASTGAPPAFQKGQFFLVFTTEASVKMDNELRVTLRRGDVVQAFDFKDMPDSYLAFVRIGGTEGWVAIDNLVRCEPLQQAGCQILPLEDDKEFEIRFSQLTARRLSEKLQKINEERVADVVRQVVGPTANAAGRAIAVGATGNPGAGKVGGEMAEFACEAVIAAAKGNLKKFKAELASAADQGNVVIHFTPNVSLAGKVIRIQAGRAPDVGRAAEQIGLIHKGWRGECDYVARIQKVMTIISPTTLVDSACWKITSLSN